MRRKPRLDYILFPHLEQNFALDFRADPHEPQTGPLGLCFGNNAGSGRGSSPGVEKAADAETIEGGCPIPGSVDAVICDGGGPIPGGIGLAIVEPPAARPPAILSSDFFSSKITLTDKNSNDEYDTT